MAKLNDFYGKPILNTGQDFYKLYNTNSWPFAKPNANRDYSRRTAIAEGYKIIHPTDPSADYTTIENCWNAGFDKMFLLNGTHQMINSIVDVVTDRMFQFRGESEDGVIIQQGASSTIRMSQITSQESYTYNSDLEDIRLAHGSDTFTMNDLSGTFPLDSTGDWWVFITNERNLHGNKEKEHTFGNTNGEYHQITNVSSVEGTWTVTLDRPFGLRNTDGITGTPKKRVTFMKGFRTKPFLMENLTLNLANNNGFIYPNGHFTIGRYIPEGGYRVSDVTVNGNGYNFSDDYYDEGGLFERVKFYHAGYIRFSNQYGLFLDCEFYNNSYAGRAMYVNCLFDNCMDSSIVYEGFFYNTTFVRCTMSYDYIHDSCLIIDCHYIDETYYERYGTMYHEDITLLSGETLKVSSGKIRNYTQPL